MRSLAAEPTGRIGAEPDCSTNHDRTGRTCGQYLFYHDHHATKRRMNLHFRRVVALFISICGYATTHTNAAASDVIIMVSDVTVNRSRTTSATLNAGFDCNSCLAIHLTSDDGSLTNWYYGIINACCPRNQKKNPLKNLNRCFLFWWRDPGSYRKTGSEC